jgi:flagellar basal-body rod protein FlgB
MNFDTAFGIHDQAVRVRAQRAQVLAANMANADTPGYKARDFDFNAVLRNEMQRPVRLVSTHPNHVHADRGVVASTQMGYRIPQQPSLDGNTVEIEREQSAFSENAMRYEASLRFLDSKVKGLLRAIKGQG